MMIQRFGFTVCLTIATTLSAAPPHLISKSRIYSYPVTDPYDLKNLHGFNHAPSVLRMPDGRIWAAWFSGPFEASVHQSIVGSFSTDEGATWSPGKVIQDIPRVSDFDPAFITDGKRGWLTFSAGRWNRYPFLRAKKGETEAIGVKSYQLFARATEDSGVTWSEPQRMIEETGFGCRTNGIHLTTGELLLPVYSFGPPHSSGVIKSTDGGKTWNRFGKVAPSIKAGAAEPTIVELSDGSVLMALRTTDGFLWTSRSSDRGETWSEPIKTDMPAAQSSANLFRLSDGRIALTHGPCKPPLRDVLTIRVSSDDANTWGEPLTLAEVDAAKEDEDVWGRQVTYPSVTQLKNGDLLVVWVLIELSNERQSGVIESARVRVP